MTDTPDLFSQDPTPVPSVSQLTGQIKDLLEASFHNVDVEGEVSKPTRSHNGHVYFTLKDDRAQLPCVIWRSAASRLSFTPEHGQQLHVSGDIQVYAPHGRYQLIVKQARQAGVGALQQAFERLKQKLMKEGLFDQDVKKRLPSFPKRAGIVTSAQGAALQDIISTFEKRYPMITLVIYHASVQGMNAAGEITRGINYFSKHKNVDVLIVTRGGGSLEDLWPFNEEKVARALFECPVPTISAVGHETDFCITDFVADVRAATPTQTVALMVPDINDLKFQVDEYQRTLRNTIEYRLQSAKDKAERFAKTYALQAVREKVRSHQTNIMHLNRKALSAMELKLVNNRRVLEKLTSALQNLNPDAPLEQGYTRIWQNGKWIRKSTGFSASEPFEIQWKEKSEKIQNSE